MQRVVRVKKELERFEKSPPPGVSCWCTDDEMLDELEASIMGPPDTPFDRGVFKLKISLPERYPFEPPQVLFLTKLYHPNVDTAGRICLDILKVPPKGTWRPSQNLSSLLMSIRLLLSEPNPDDPLMADIAQEYQCNRSVFMQKAKNWTEMYAMHHRDGESKENAVVL